MAQVALFTATTDAVATQAEADITNYTFGILSCALATTEEVDIYARVSPTAWGLVTDTAGAAVKLTASIPHIQLAGGICYGVLKDATATAAAVYLSYGSPRPHV